MKIKKILTFFIKLLLYILVSSLITLSVTYPIVQINYVYDMSQKTQLYAVTIAIIIGTFLSSLVFRLIHKG